MTRAEIVAAMESDGDMVPGCHGCAERYAAEDPQGGVFAPRHKASARCESGRRPHCTCDVCW